MKKFLQTLLEYPSVNLVISSLLLTSTCYALDLKNINDLEVQYNSNEPESTTKKVIKTNKPSDSPNEEANNPNNDKSPQKAIFNVRLDKLIPDDKSLEKDDGTFEFNKKLGMEYPAFDAQYGPVVPGETLSQIAKNLQTLYPDLDIYQIMKVLFDENPNAFARKNINTLIPGTTLTIRDLNSIRAVSTDESKEFFRQHF